MAWHWASRASRIKSVAAALVVSATAAAYVVAETKTGLVLIAEMVDQIDAQTHLEMKQQPELNDGLLASFPAHPN